MIKCRYCDQIIEDEEDYYELDDKISCISCEKELWDECMDNHRFTNEERAEWDDHVLDEIRGK